MKSHHLQAVTQVRQSVKILFTKYEKIVSVAAIFRLPHLTPI